MSSASLPPQPRIVVVGAPGAGKTTLARCLAEKLGIPHIELDAIHWGPNWQEIPLEVFRECLAVKLLESTWVVDGNYSKVRDIVWGQANTLIWLDYAFPLVFSRLVWRSVRRIAQQEELWNGNRERLVSVFSRDSLILWMIRKYRQHRKQYPELFARPEYSHLQVIRLCSSSTANRWISAQEVDHLC